MKRAAAAAAVTVDHPAGLVAAPAYATVVA